MGRLGLLARLLVCAGVSFLVPAQVAGRGARGFYEGQAEAQLALSDGVERWVRRPLDVGDFHTGNALFDAEWLFGSYMMAAMGLGQVALEHPQVRARHADAIADCLDRLLSVRIRAFDSGAWDSDALDSLGSMEGHVAYLGYLNLALGMHRKLEPTSPFAVHNDRISAALARRFEASESGLIATYPGEYYPVDNLAAIASLSLHGQVTGDARGAQVAALVERIRADYVDHETGLLIQAVTRSGRRADDARGSGTALAAYFAAYASPALGRELHAALKSQLGRHVLGFAAVREYVHERGKGDVDSGPLLLGLSISATGFSLGSARTVNDFDHFEGLYRTAHLFGAPQQSSESMAFAGGGPLGNAIMLAMLTAPRAEVLR